MLVAGVDSSTQACKVIIVDSSTGVIVRGGQAEHPQGTEVNPDDWWAAFKKALNAAGGTDDVGAISIAAQQHGMVALDDGGNVIRPAMLWNDTRAAASAKMLIDEVGAQEYVQRTGLLPVASFTASKLRWLRDHEPSNARRVAAVALPHDWLTWRLRGFGPQNPVLSELTTDRSDASGTAYWGPNGYDRELFVSALGHDALRPRVLDPSELAGTTVSGIPVGAGAGDNAAAALGLNLRNGDVAVSLGTSGTVFTATSSPVEDYSGSVASFASATGTYLPLIATLNAARVLDKIAELLAVDHDELSRLAIKGHPGAGGVVLVPWFEGERTPNLPFARAQLRGLSLENTNRVNIARAAYEGMLSSVASGLDLLRDIGLCANRVVLIGGAARSPASRVVATNVFDTEVIVPEATEFVALGAARQAAWSVLGTIPTWDLPVEFSSESCFSQTMRSRYKKAATNVETSYR